MDIAPDVHSNETPTGGPTTEAVDPPSTTTITETTISKPQTRRIKRFLLLEPPPATRRCSHPPSPLVSPKLKSRTLDTLRLTKPTCSLNPHQELQMTHLPQQDRSRSYPAGQIVEYPIQNHNERSKSEAEDTRPTETATTKMRAECPQVMQTTHQHRTNPSPTQWLRSQNTSDNFLSNFT